MKLEGEYQIAVADPEYLPPPKSKCAHVWTTRNGQQVSIFTMTDAHLVNTIRFIRRNADQRLLRSRTLANLVGEVFCKSEAAHDVQQIFEKMTAFEWLTRFVPQYSVMLREVERRSLEGVEEQLAEASHG